MTFEPLGERRNERLNKVVAAITAELMHQDNKWGSGKPQSLAGYLLIMQHEINEAITGWMKNLDGRNAPLAEIVQVAAVAIRCLEDYGTKGSARATRDVTEAEMALERSEAINRRVGALGPMAWTPPKPAETYDALVKQFRALCTLHACVEAQLRSIQSDKHREMQARAQVDGERAANQVLTNEIDRLLAEIEMLRAKGMSSS